MPICRTFWFGALRLAGKLDIQLTFLDIAPTFHGTPASRCGTEGEPREMSGSFAPRSSAGTLAAMSIAALVAACAGSGPSPSVAPPSSATTQPGETVPPSPRAQRFTFSDTPVVTGASAGIDTKYVNPGAVIEHDGILHMFPNYFDEWPGLVRIPHLTSSDGIKWTLDPKAAVLRSDEIELADPGADVSTGFVTDGGTWVLIFETVSISKPWVLGRATADSPTGPWKIDSKPVLSPDPEGWDAGGLQWPSVVRTHAGWAMYYTGVDATSRHGSIGLATSTDGEHWSKHKGPVFEPEAAWEAGSLDRPRVAATANGYVMVYAGAVLLRRGVAVSPDGVVWTRSPGPAIDLTNLPNRQSAWDAAVLANASELVYFLESGTLAGTKVFRGTLTLP